MTPPVTRPIVFRQPAAHAAQGWDGVEERRAFQPPGECGTCISAIERYIDQRLTANSEAHRKYFDEKLDGLLEAIEAAIAAGFPEGDAAAHRKVHEGYIRDAAEWRAFKAKLLAEVAKVVVIGCLAVGGGWIWFGFKADVTARTPAVVMGK